MAKASAPTPICRIEVVRAAISPSQRAKSRRHTFFPQELSHLNGPNFLGVNVLLVVRDAVFWDLSRDVLRLCPASGSTRRRQTASKSGPSPS